MVSQKHQIKNKPSSARASVGALVLVSRGGGCNHRGMASSGKLQSQRRSSTSAQLNPSIYKEEHRKQSVQIYSSEKKSTPKISSSKQMVERVSCSSRGSQKTTTKISSSKQREERVTANATRTQTLVKEEEMIRREYGSVAIDMRTRSEMQFETTKKNYASSKGSTVTQDDKFRIGVEFEVKMKH